MHCERLSPGMMKTISSVLTSVDISPPVFTMHAATTDNSQSKQPKSMKSIPPKTVRDTYYYPIDIAQDLKNIDLPEETKKEVYACAWEYARCVIPQYTNWNRYVAFMRTIVIGIIAEFRGSMVDVAASDELLGYDLNDVLNSLFLGTAHCDDMHREYRAFLLITADKASGRRDGELFRRYVNALARSPRQWFRMRDCDALARFTIASALACNDLNDIHFTDEEFELLTEIGSTLYDAVAFFKHRSEGETNSTFAYMPQDQRIDAFRRHRELLWALDVVWARNPPMTSVTNFVRFFGGPIHMTMHRYRFVEEDLTIGRVETATVVRQTRRNSKLWNRVDATGQVFKDDERYQELLAKSDRLMFRGLKEIMQAADDGHCEKCKFRTSYGATTTHCFGGVQLCASCVDDWRSYLDSLEVRATKQCPGLELVRQQASKPEANRTTSYDGNRNGRKRSMNSTLEDDGDNPVPIGKRVKTERSDSGYATELVDSPIMRQLRGRAQNRAGVGRGSY